MKKNVLFILIFLAPAWLMAQSVTTEKLQKAHSDALSLFFYNNTLRMLNQADDKDFDELIKDIEKMRFLMIKKDQKHFTDNDFKKLIADYKAESFEEALTSRHEGKNFDVFIREKDGRTNGMLVLINDSTNLYVLDILGRIALNKITKLYSTIDESTDIGSKIKAFTGQQDND
ncbi:MAG TPA: DUF4252 domain-containing protein [Chryseosolibacter sp.]|jgi:hypothetical protein|nr:DUF4252 domain-containing protein [Chryseosolibacter sp.]